MRASSGDPSLRATDAQLPSPPLSHRALCLLRENCQGTEKDQVTADGPDREMEEAEMGAPRAKLCISL